MNYLEHHGIKGQKWGIRRFQNPDGTLTPLGKKRYGTSENLQKQVLEGMAKDSNEYKKAWEKANDRISELVVKGSFKQSELKKAQKEVDKIMKALKKKYEDVRIQDDYDDLEMLETGEVKFSKYHINLFLREGGHLGIQELMSAEPADELKESWKGKKSLGKMERV